MPARPHTALKRADVAPRRTPRPAVAPPPSPPHLPRMPWRTSVTGHAGSVAGATPPHTPVTAAGVRGGIVGSQGGEGVVAACRHPLSRPTALLDPVVSTRRCRCASRRGGGVWLRRGSPCTLPPSLSLPLPISLPSFLSLCVPLSFVGRVFSFACASCVLFPASIVVSLLLFVRFVLFVVLSAPRAFPPSSPRTADRVAAAARRPSASARGCDHPATTPHRGNVHRPPPPARWT